MNRSLELFDVPLAGAQLIEASAGTGKTWTICGLFVRLLLERALRVREILVVTFTNAATAELKARVRDRLESVSRALEDDQAAVADPFNADLIRRLANGESAGVDLLRARERIDLALAEFDEASIYTIHGFCQRALAEIPFSAGLPFSVEVVQSDAEWIERTATDFFRRSIAAGHHAPHVAAYLRRELAPDTLASSLKSVLGRPLAELRFPRPSDPTPLDHYANQWQVVRAVWRAAREEIVIRLQGNLPALKANAYTPETVERAAAAWDRLLASPFAVLPASKDETGELKYFSAENLEKQTRKGATTPEHAFFDHAARLLALSEAATRVLDEMRLALLERFLHDGPDEVRSAKRLWRRIGYDDMLFNLHRALEARSGSWLAGVLRRRYPAALIDEFQDTDPLQYAIFRAIYAETGLPVFTVGDPKQSIYAFRHADLFSYLAAASETQSASSHTLTVNQRSNSDLVAATNALFERNPLAFVLDGIRFDPVRPARSREWLLRDPARCAALAIWKLPSASDGKPRSSGACQELAVRATVSEVVRLLGLGTRETAILNGKPLSPRDIAVIVRTHQQARIVKQALRAAGVGAVERGRRSVWRSEEAEWMLRLMAAIAEPSDAGLVSAALASPVFGLRASEIDEERRDERRLAERFSAFAEYRECWQHRGFAVMWRRLLSESHALGRLLSGAEGERRITNYRHLAELVHDASRYLEGIDALLRWFQRRSAEAPESEEAQLRLESDEQLIQIVTIHACKGLEFPVAFCPFLWLGTSRRSGKTEPIEYHEDGHAVVSFVPGDAAAESRQRIEVFAEQVRLIYVALTRAVCRTYLVAGNYLSGKSEIPCRTSALNWLIGGAGTGPGDWLDGKGPSLDAIESAWMQFAADAAPNVILSAIPVPETSAALAARRPDRLLRARPAERRVTDSWRIESFTSLAAAAGSARAEQAADHDERLALQARTAEPPAELPEHDPLRFPRGPRAGVLLHAALEHADFAQPGSWGGAIAAAIARAAAGGDRDRAPVADVSLTEILRVILHNVLTTDLDGCGLRLEGVTNEMRLSELGFVLSVRGASAARLASAIEAAGFPACAMSFETIEGYLNGAIDCVFRHEGRYYLADWKSNFLGWMPADYRKAALDQVMRQEDYSLQAAIYSVALHRYLRRRLAGYDPDAHFGGVYYLFARAVRPDWRDDQGRPTGVWSLGLGAAQLDSLDACFG